MRFFLVFLLATIAVWSLSWLFYTHSTPRPSSVALVEHHHDHQELQDSHAIQAMAGPKARDSSSHVMTNVSVADYADNAVIDVSRSVNVILLLKELSKNASSSMQVGIEPTAHMNRTCFLSPLSVGIIIKS